MLPRLELWLVSPQCQTSLRTSAAPIGQEDLTGGNAPAHVNLAALGAGGLANSAAHSRLANGARSTTSSSRASSNRGGPGGHLWQGQGLNQGALRGLCPSLLQVGQAAGGISGSVSSGMCSSMLAAGAAGVLPSRLLPSDGASTSYELKRSANTECIAGMDMIGELFQQQAKRLEMQLYQQLRDQADIETIHNRFSCASQQLQRLQAQNLELRRLVEANETNIRSMYEHARAVQSAQNALLSVCDDLSKDAALLRQALKEENPGVEVSAVVRPALPARSAELPPLQSLLPPPATNGESPQEIGLGGHQHMETALALLSTVATHKADSSPSQPGSAPANGVSEPSIRPPNWDANASDQQGSNGSDTGSNHGSSNTGTEDTATLSRDGNRNERSSASKGSPDEVDSGDGHGSDSNGDSPVDRSADSSRDVSGESKGSGESNGDSGEGTSGASGASNSASGSNSSSPPHEQDVEPPPEPHKEVSGAKRKR